MQFRYNEKNIKKWEHIFSLVTIEKRGFQPLILIRLIFLPSASKASSKVPRAAPEGGRSAGRHCRVAMVPAVPSATDGGEGGGVRFSDAGNESLDW